MLVGTRGLKDYRFAPFCVSLSKWAVMRHFERRCTRTLNQNRRVCNLILTRPACWVWFGLYLPWSTLAPVVSRMCFDHPAVINQLVLVRLLLIRLHWVPRETYCIRKVHFLDCFPLGLSCHMQLTITRCVLGVCLHNLNPNKYDYNVVAGSDVCLWKIDIFIPISNIINIFVKDFALSQLLSMS